jgi:hypothetical protein
MGIAVDEDVFERWKKSKTKARRRGIGPGGVVVLLLTTAVGAAISFGVAVAAAPSQVVATVQGHVVKSEHDWDDEDVHEEAREWLRHHVTVRLDSGEKTSVDLPRGEEVRLDALVKLDVYRKALGPMSMEFHKFAGYVDATK